jgi:hypothetical protein
MKKVVFTKNIHKSMIKINGWLFTRYINLLSTARTHFRLAPTSTHIIIPTSLSLQNVKDASDAEARKCNYTINESKKLHNKRLNR